MRARSARRLLMRRCWWTATHRSHPLACSVRLAQLCSRSRRTHTDTQHHAGPHGTHQVPTPKHPTSCMYTYSHAQVNHRQNQAHIAPTNRQTPGSQRQGQTCTSLRITSDAPPPAFTARSHFAHTSAIVAAYTLVAVTCLLARPMVTHTVQSVGQAWMG